MDLKKIGSQIVQPPCPPYKYAWVRMHSISSQTSTLAVDQSKETYKHGVVQATPRVGSPARRRFPCRLSS